MTNVKTKITGDKLYIEIALSKEFGPSKSGKTIIIASTQGNIKLDPPHDDISIGINCYKK